MNEIETFVLADRTLNEVVDRIADDQWAMVIPPDFAMRQTEQRPTLREMINYHAYDDSWVPDMLAGRTMEQAGKDKFDGDLLGTRPKDSFAAIVERACRAAEALDDLDRVVHLSFGDFLAREYFWQINSFRGLRAHDLAKVIGADPTLPADLVHALWDEISPNAEHWRVMGVFPAAVPVPDDAPLQNRLLGLTGRQPD